MDRNSPIFYQELDGELQVYCESLNSLIRWFAVCFGKHTSTLGGTTHMFFDGLVRCIYFDSDYGNDRYSLEVVKEDRLVPVYSLLDKVTRPVITLMFPGDWLGILNEWQSEYRLESPLFDRS